MISPISFNFIPGGFDFAVNGGFNLTISWLGCFLVYAGTHLTPKIVRKYKAMKKK